MTTGRRAPAWRRYLRFWGSNVTQDVDDEISFHVEMRTREYVARGLSENVARQTALARLGSVAAAREECLAIGAERERNKRHANLLDTIATDVRFALRSLARSPGWTAVALLTVAVGIGASTAVFSIVDGLLLHPIAYPASKRIVVVRREVTWGSATMFMYPSPTVVDAWRRSSRSIDAIEGFARRDMALGSGEDARVAHAVAIAKSFLDFTGVRPLVGRNFSTDETQLNGPHAVLLSESFWQREFGGARNVVGKTLAADGQSLTIVGVLPATLQLPELGGDRPDLWLPLVKGGDRRLGGVVARLRPGVSVGTAEKELGAIAVRFDDAPTADGPHYTIKVIRPGDTFQFRGALLMLSGAVALLFLVVCGNLAHLLLARGAARERELAVRYALGAGRSRLVRQLLTESLVVCLLGAAGAVFIAVEGLRVTAALRPASLSALSQVSINQRVLVIALVLSVVTGLCVGTLAALRTARRGLGDSLRAGAGSGAGRPGRRLRSSLVVTEIALSATLLVGALLLVHSVINLETADLGFDARNLYGLTLPVRGAQQQSAAQRNAVAQLLVDRGRQIPAALAVTAAAAIPPNGPYVGGVFEAEGHSALSSEPSTISQNFVSPDYFTVLRIPLLAGRTFDARSAERNEVIVNQSFATQLWPNESPVGKRYRIAGDGPNRDAGASPWFTVIAVARDAVTRSVLDARQTPALYGPIESGLEHGRVTLIVRSRDGADPTAALRRLATEVRPDARIPAITNVELALNDSFAEPRFSMIVLTTFAALAVVLAAVGLYGVISYTVTQRTREIGIRMTLGATRRAIAALVIGDGLRLSLIGVTLGLLGATMATRIIQTALYGVQRGDPWSFAIGAAALVCVSALACLIPTMRATAVDPAVAVRVE